MERYVFVSSFEKKVFKAKNTLLYQLELKIFDKNNNESTFSSSLMPEKEINNYQNSLLKLLKATTKLQVSHGPYKETFETIKDDTSSQIIALQTADAIILRNEIKFF